MSGYYNVGSRELFSLCLSISPVFFLFLQKPYVVFAHKCVCNLYLYNCVEDFHFEMNPDIDIFPVLKDLFLLFLTPETMLYQTKQNHFVVQHLKTDLTTQIANRQKIQQRVLECSSIFFVLASRYCRVFFSIRSQSGLILENGALVICPFLPTTVQQHHYVSIQRCFNNVFSLLTLKI